MRMIWFPQSQDLFAASLALQDADPALRDLELFRQEADQGGIGRTIHGSCLYPDFQGVAMLPGNLGAFGARLGMNGKDQISILPVPGRIFSVHVNPGPAML